MLAPALLNVVVGATPFRLALFGSSEYHFSVSQFLPAAAALVSLQTLGSLSPVLAVSPSLAISKAAPAESAQEPQPNSTLLRITRLPVSAPPAVQAPLVVAVSRISVQLSPNAVTSMLANCPYVPRRRKMPESVPSLWPAWFWAPTKVTLQKSGSEIGVARLSNSLLSASTPRESAPVSVMLPFCRYTAYWT